MKKTMMIWAAAFTLALAAGCSGGGGSAGSATVTLLDETYEFTDVRDCNLTQEYYGDDWREFIGWTEDGMNLLKITYDETALEVSNVNVSIGAQEAFENANFEQDWMAFTDFEFTTLDDGIEGSSPVSRFGPGPNEGVAEVVFTCG
ncbi:MAG: hypothetical protein ACK5KU_09235 [Beutenbergiaceae bacterium]